MDSRKEFRFFTIWGYEKEQEYLRAMHLSGWKFTAVRGLGMYHFEKCAPEDVVYQLDYNQEGVKHKEEYVRMFADCGWEYIQDYVGFSYFRKPASQTDGAEEIFCDEDSRRQMLERVMKGRVVPLLILFFCVMLPQFLIHMFATRNYAAAAVMGVVMLIYIAVFVLFAWKYRQFEERHGQTGQPARYLPLGVGMGMGLGIGLCFGAAMDNIAVGLALGVCFGTSFSTILGRRKDK